MAHSHLLVLLIKNLLLEIRSPVWLAFEIIFAVLGIILLLWANAMFGADGKFVYPTFMSANHGLPSSSRIGWALESGCCRSNVSGLVSLGKLKNFTGLAELKTNLTIGNSGNVDYGLIIEEYNMKEMIFKYRLLAASNKMSALVPERYLGAMHLLYEPQDVAGALQDVDNLFIQDVYKKNNISTGVGVIPRMETVGVNGFISSRFYNLLAILLLLPMLMMVRSLISERDTINPYLRVMGMTKADFYLSHSIVTFLKMLLISMVYTVLSHSGMTGLPWLIVILTIVLFCVAMTGFCCVISTFFKSTATVTQLVAIGTIIWFVMEQFTTDGRDPTWYACLLTLAYPPYGVHYIMKYAYAAVNFDGKPRFFSSKYTQQNPGLVMLTQLAAICLYAGFIQGKIHSLGKVLCNLCQKKRRKESSNKEELTPLATEVIQEDAEADLVLEDVVKQYPTGERAVRRINLKALRGHVTVLLGHNGAGKTTTFSMICGVEKPTEGKVLICGEEAGTKAALRHIGYCAQVNTIIDKLTVKDHLWLAHKLKGAKGNYWHKGQELLATVGLLDFATARAGKLSGGQKRKLCVCMALIGDTQVVLLDEPTAGMDPESRKDVQALLESIKKEKTILLTTHYMDEADELGDQMFIMAAGWMICSGSSQFLKQKFGTGYILTIVAAKGYATADFGTRMITTVRQHTPMATLGEVRGSQVEITIPVDQQTMFPRLFMMMESDQARMGVETFGLSLNTLEQVFLRVTTMAGNHEERADAAVVAAFEKIYNTDTKPWWLLFLTQLKALLFKKCIYQIRFWSSLFMALVMPALFVTMVLLATRAVGGESQQTHGISLGSIEGDIFVYNNGTNGSDALTKFEQLAGSRSHAVGAGGLDPFFKGKYPTEFAFGAVFTPSEELLLVNTEIKFALLTAVNTLSNAHLPNGSITASVETFKLDTKFAALEYVLNVLLGLIAIICVCQSSSSIIEDRISGFAHLQMLTGVKPIVYWLADFLYGLFFFSIQMAICIVTMAIVTDTMNGATAFHFFLLLLLYYWAMVPSVYVVSRFMRSGAMATIVLLLFHFLTFLFVLIGIHGLAMRFNLRFDSTKINILEMEPMEVINLILSVLSPTNPMIDCLIWMATLQNKGSTTMPGGHGIKSLLYFKIGITFASGLFYLGLFLLCQLHSVKRVLFMCCKQPCSKRIPEFAYQTMNDAGGRACVVETIDLSRGYRKKVGLSHLTMGVYENECFGLLGVSGAGKTTTFNILTRQMFSTKGKAYIDGKSVNTRQTLGFCPQFDAIHPKFTGREALILLADLYGYKNPKATVKELLFLMNMEEHADKKFGECSGGQKRRLSVAAAILPKKSPVIILDEATAGIDPKARRDIWKVLGALKAYSAILMSSHSMEECEALCCRIGILKQGGLAALGSSQSLKSKYGNFYVLTITVPPFEPKIQEVRQAVASYFSGAVEKTAHRSLNLKWQLPKTPWTTWSSMFNSCLQLSHQIGIRDFCLTQSSLQDIFLLFAETEPAPADSTPSQSWASHSRASNSGVGTAGGTTTGGTATGGTTTRGTSISSPAT